MPRLVYLAGLALLLLAGAFLLTDALLWEPGVTERNVRRVRPGMSLAEAERLLGGLGAPLPSGVKGSRWRLWAWDGQRGAAWVEADGGRVTAAGWSAFEPPRTRAAGTAP